MYKCYQYKTQTRDTLEIFKKQLRFINDLSLL